MIVILKTPITTTVNKANNILYFFSFNDFILKYISATKLVIINDSNGVLVPTIRITEAYIILKSIFNKYFPFELNIKKIIGVKIDMIPLISLAELKNPSVPDLVISYVL